MKFKKCLITLPLLFASTLSFANNSSNIDISAITTSGCVLKAHDIHFDFSQNQGVINSVWHVNHQSVFDLEKFLKIDIQCSKGVSFYLAGDNATAPQGSLTYTLKYVGDTNAPAMTYWLNNWSAQGYSSMTSPNISRLQTGASRLANKANNLYYKVNDGNPAWLRFAVQVEGTSIYNYQAGDYSDTIGLVLTY